MCGATQQRLAVWLLQPIRPARCPVCVPANRLSLSTVEKHAYAVTRCPALATAASVTGYAAAKASCNQDMQSCGPACCAATHSSCKTDTHPSHPRCEHAPPPSNGALLSHAGLHLWSVLCRDRGAAVCEMRRVQILYSVDLNMINHMLCRVELVMHPAALPNTRHQLQQQPTVQQQRQQQQRQRQPPPLLGRGMCRC